MGDATRQIDADLHRRLGVDLFNEVWSLLDKADRTDEDAERMVHAAHASRYHWGIVGQPVNFARGDWQISRVYAVLSCPERALHYAMRSLEICQAHGIGDFDLAFAYEALARAHAAAGSVTDRDAALRKAKQAATAIKDKEDREVFVKELSTVPADTQ